MFRQQIGMYRGKVLKTDSEEVDKLGRIKVEVAPFLLSPEGAREIGEEGGIVVDDMPWATPAYGLFVGAGMGSGVFTVPDIGSYVWVFFEAGDVHQPVYFAEACDGVHGLPEERLSNYPNTFIIKTNKGDTIEFDKDKQTISINFNGSYINIDESGNVNIKGGNIHLN